MTTVDPTNDYPRVYPRVYPATYSPRASVVDVDADDAYPKEERP